MFVKLRGTRWLRAMLQAEIEKNATLLQAIAEEKKQH